MHASRVRAYLLIMPGVVIACSRCSTTGPWPCSYLSSRSDGTAWSPGTHGSDSHTPNKPVHFGQCVTHRVPGKRTERRCVIETSAVGMEARMSPGRQRLSRESQPSFQRRLTEPFACARPHRRWLVSRWHTGKSLKCWLPALVAPREVASDVLGVVVLEQHDELLCVVGAVRAYQNDVECGGCTSCLVAEPIHPEVILGGSTMMLRMVLAAAIVALLLGVRLEAIVPMVALALWVMAVRRGRSETPHDVDSRDGDD